MIFTQAFCSLGMVSFSFSLYVYVRLLFSARSLYSFTPHSFTLDRTIWGMPSLSSDPFLARKSSDFFFISGQPGCAGLHSSTRDGFGPYASFGRTSDMFFLGQTLYVPDGVDLLEAYDGTCGSAFGSNQVLRGVSCSCPSGYYACYNSPPSLCPPGSFCPPNSLSPTLCPSGHYCPLQSSASTPCPVGLSSSPSSFSVSDCH